MDRGVSLIEMLLVMVVLGVVAGIGASPVRQHLDELKVFRAVNEVSSVYRDVRLLSMLTGRASRVVFQVDTVYGYLEGLSGDSLVRIRPGPSHRGVVMTVNRPEVRVGPTGASIGAANTTLVFRRGTVVDSLVISRVGRMRRRVGWVQPSRR